MPEKIITPEALEEYYNACLLDDAYVQAFFRDNIKVTAIFLRIIMNKPDLIVKSVNVQYVMKGSKGSRGVRFDVYAVDSEGRQYDIEFQIRAKGANTYRASYNAAMMTVNTLNTEEDPSVLAERERIVIFITKTDVLRGRRPLYTIKRMIVENGRQFNDGETIIYVNVSHKDLTTELGKLLHDIRSRKTEDMLNPDLAERSKAVRKEEEAMKAWEKMQQDIAEETKDEMRHEFALALLRAGQNTLEVIADVCRMTVEQVEELAATLKTQGII